MPAASAHLLRTLASVAPGARVVDVACDQARHLDPLARLGFDVWGSAEGSLDAPRQSLAEAVGADEAARRVTHAAPDALGYPDAWADWVVLSDVAPERLAPALTEAARVLKPGAWVWVEGASAQALAEAARGAGLEVAETPAEDDGVTHAIYRRSGAIG